MTDSGPSPPRSGAEWTSSGELSGQPSLGSLEDLRSGGDRYIQQRLLGEGAMGAVYLVHDRETGEQLALKKLFRMDPRSVLRLKREFRSLVDLSHPNLIRVYEIGRASDGWFLTMEFVDGQDLQSYLGVAAARSAGSRIDSAFTQLASWRSWLEQALMPAFHQLACGVHALHRAGMLHRDLKPGNVLVSNHRVLVLDFGLVRELDPKAPSLTEDGAIAGTPAYMAPEQAVGKALTEASDWYAFGVMLYEALTGELPFEGTVFDVLRAKLDRDPQPPEARNPDVPAGLSELCMALLSRDPSARPKGSHVLACLEPVRPSVLAPASLSGDTSVQTETQSSAGLAFFGREAELAALWDAMHQAEQGRSVVVHVRGISGAGKSALVEQFLDQIEDRVAMVGQPSALVLRSRCYEREAMPFKALDGVIDALGRHLAHVDDIEVGNLLPTDIAALAQLFPVLERLRAVQRLLSAKGAFGGAVQSRQRAEGALRELFRRLSSRRPVVVWIDDLQWGDLDSAGILRGWLQHAADMSVVLVLSYRADEVGTSPCLRVLLGSSQSEQDAPPCTVEVPALAPEDVMALCREKLGACAPQHGPLIARIVREAQGSPYLAAQLAALAAAKLARGDADVGAITLNDLVTQMKALLPPDARLLLRVLSVAGRPIAPKLALRAAAIRSGGRELLHLLRRLQLVRTRDVAGERLLEVYHDRVRESVQRLLSAVESEHLHASLLAVLEYSGRADPDWLHVHAIGAGQRVAAYRYGLAAAERAMATLAFERAAELYERCIELGELAAEERCLLVQKLAFALDCCGRGTKAADAYLEAARLAGREDAVRLMRLASSHLLRSGRFEEGEAMQQRVIDAMALRVPRTQGGLVLAIVWERLRVALRGKRVVARDAAEVPAALLARIDVFEMLRQETLTLHPVRAALFLARSVRLALEAGEPVRMLHALCGLCYMAATSGSARAERRVEQLLAQADALVAMIGTPAAKATLSVNRALASFMLGRPENVLAASYEAERLYREHTTSQLDASYHARLAVVSARTGALYAMSDHRTFARELSSALQEARATANVAAELHFALNETLLDELLGRPQVAVDRLERQRAQLPRSGFGVYHVLHMVSVCYAACASGRYAWGMRLLDEDWPQYLRSPLRHTASLALYARMGRARLLFTRHMMERASSPLTNRQLRAEIDLLARSQLRARATPIADALRARLLHSEGRREQALALVRRVMETVTYEGDVERVRYLLGLMLGGAEGRAICQQSASRLSELGPANARSYLDLYYPELAYPEPAAGG